jgi:hypothetical protein
MSPRSVALTGAACVTIGWLLASVLAPPVARLQSRAPARTPAAAAAAPPPATFTETLQLKLQRHDTPPTPRRNPFVFGAPETRGGTGAPTRAAANDAPAEAPAAPAIVTPPFTLSGIAATVTADVEVRTAVLSDGHTVHLVKAGESVGGYRVVSVVDDAVTLADAAGAQFVIRLR